MRSIHFLIYALTLVLAVSCQSGENEPTNGPDIISYERVRNDYPSQRLNDTNNPDLPQVGQASFYADRFHGQATASGEPYDSAAFTAAHRSLPFGTKVKVTNLRNDKSVILTINDRGPFHKQRIIDVSKAAARKLGFIKRGTTRVRIEEAPE